MIADDGVDRSLADVIIDTGAIGALAGLVGIALGAILTAALVRRTARRERYAAMAATLAAWGEVPYRIKRRTSNTSDCIDALSEMMHEIQQNLVIDHTDLQADCRWLARTRDDAQREIQEAVRPWIKEAWASPPISSSEEMNFNGWGPVGIRSHVEEFADGIRWRFGWRRLLSPARRMWRWLQH